MIQHIQDNTVLKMSQHILSLLITYMGAVQVFSSLSTKFVVDRDNSTFEIVLQPHRECPEQYYRYKARHGEFFLNDGRDVTKESRKLCIKCSKCLDGIEVVRHCTAYRDVLCGSKCVQSGFRFDEGTRSCQHEKVLDEGYNHEELRKWLAELEQEKSVVSEVGSTPKPRHIDTQTTDVTEHRHQGLQKTVLETSQSSTTPPTQTSDESGRLFDVISSDEEEISDEQQTRENLPRPAADDYPATLQQLLFIVLLTLLVFTLLLYAFAAVRKFRPGLLSRMFVRQRQLPAPVTIEVSSGRVPRAVTVLTSLRTSAHRDGSRDKPQPPGDVSCSDGSYEDTDDYDDDTSDIEEKSLLVDGNLNLPSSHTVNGLDVILQQKRKSESI